MRRVRGHDDELGRLLEFAAAGVDVGHPRRVLAARIEIDPGHVRMRPVFEVVAMQQDGEYTRLGARLRIVAAAEPFAVAAVRAFAHLHTVEVAVGLRRVRRRCRERMPAEVARGLFEQHGAHAALERRQRVLPPARALVGVATRLDDAVQIAGLARDPAQVLESVVIGLEIVVGDAPVLDRHVLRNEVRSVALDGMAPHLEIGRQEAPRLSVPVHARAAGAGRRPERAQLAHRQRRLLLRVAERQRLAFGLLEQPVADGVAQLVLDMIGREVGNRVPESAALEREDVQAFVGQLLAENARRPAEADEHDVDGGQFGRHRHPSCTPLSWPSMLTNGMSYFFPYWSTSAT